MKQLRIALLTVLALFTLVAAASAQTATPKSQFAWDQAASSALEATSYVYEVELDGTVLAEPLVGVACTGSTSPFQCLSPIPAIVPGNHTARLRAKINGAPVASDFSNLTSFLMIAVPSAPQNFRVTTTP